MLAQDRFRLLAAPRRDAVTGFVAIADEIMRRDRVCLVRALQQAVDAHPAAFESYCRAFGVR